MEFIYKKFHWQPLAKTKTYVGRVKIEGKVFSRVYRDQCFHEVRYYLMLREHRQRLESPG